MKAGEKKFQQRIEKFRNQKEITKATYTAAQTQTKISESLSGISDDFGGIGRAMTQAKDKTEQMQARSQAVNTLSEEGVLKDPLDDSDSTTTKLNDIRNKSAVEDELEKLKKQMDSDTKN
jgi:phage shock protein A